MDRYQRLSNTVSKENSLYSHLEMETPHTWSRLVLLVHWNNAFSNISSRFYHNTCNYCILITKIQLYSNFYSLHVPCWLINILGNITKPKKEKNIKFIKESTS